MRGAPQLTFHGGAETVTGSRFELAAAGQRVLVDCGMFQGLKALRDMNWEAPRFDPKKLDAVLLTHAHIDHTGYLPRLTKLGYRRPVYCTPATRELLEVLLIDAARIHEEDADYANRKGFSKHKPALPLFTEYDARVALDLLRPVQFGKRLKLGQLTVRFHPAGHILGSAFIAIDMPGEMGEHRIVFSGDMGRADQPLHADPDPLVDCDTLVLEGTYGDRAHGARSFGEEVGPEMRRTLEGGGTVLIPAFAVARAQLVVLLLQELMNRGELPRVPMHMDSPMAVDVSGIYEDRIGSAELDEMPKGQFRLFQGVQLHRSVDESRSLNNLAGPRIIISSSGMLSGGRVLHHLERLLPDPKNLVVLAGFQAAGTRGRSLQEGQPTVRMHGRDIPVGAKVVQADSLSAHADAEELLEWVQSAQQRPKSIFLVHGEPRGLEALAERLHPTGAHVHVPKLHARYELVPASGYWRSAGGA